MNHWCLGLGLVVGLHFFGFWNLWRRLRPALHLYFVNPVSYCCIYRKNETFKHIKCLVFVLNQWIFLCIAAKSYAFAQVVDAIEMLHPEVINDLQTHPSLHLSHDFRRYLLLTFVVRIPCKRRHKLGHFGSCMELFKLFLELLL